MRPGLTYERAPPIAPTCTEQTPDDRRSGIWTLRPIAERGRKLASDLVLGLGLHYAPDGRGVPHVVGKCLQKIPQGRRASRISQSAQ